MKLFSPTNRIILVLAIIFIIGSLVDIDHLRELTISAGFWAPLLFILMKISTIIFAPISGLLIYPTAGILFGFWPGFIYMVVGDFIGYSLAFFIARFFGRELVEQMVSKNEGGLLAKLVDKIGTAKGFFFTCIFAFAISDVLSYAAGLTRLRYIVFISILMPLAIFGSAMFVLFGASTSISSAISLVSVAIIIIGLILIRVVVKD